MFLTEITSKIGIISRKNNDTNKINDNSFKEEFVENLVDNDLESQSQTESQNKTQTCNYIQKPITRKHTFNCTVFCIEHAENLVGFIIGLSFFSFFGFYLFMKSV